MIASFNFFRDTMKIDNFLQNLFENPESIAFLKTIEIIDRHFMFTPTKFTNGNQQNEAGQNNGSCKIFAFAKLHNLTQQQTLSCFGNYYRHDVLQNPNAEDHQNIRQFMQNGWQDIKFDGEPLILR